ncbi:hypothetical protein [Flavobacterium lacisediminis]|uniref:TonB-dependent receptor plug domain-containing protein n=1 Tax=Flavobacterium lacisediminis TaxID=2989705 RepID=A0ABT3EFJ1_9FLAO|nr:hypothetical protein [Flavobacterium lacisediminis]MCW1147317.1 hypothetical protein [Flavobacterium lacisediminis]
MDRENVHLHFNKSTYLSNETIWFKGYIIEKKESKLNFQTTNVFVRLLDSNKTEISNQLFFASNGTIIGQIKISENLPSGDYFVHTYTNYMNNFHEDESTVQKIRIINTQDKITNNTISDNTLTIKLSFEGGKLLYQSDNNIGVSIKNCLGKGQKISNIEVKNSKDIVVNSFSTNQEGFGKFELKNTENDIYRLFISNNGETIIKELPKPIIEGINLHVNNFAIEGKVSIKINSNEITYNKFKGKNYTILIQKNDYAHFVDFNLDKINKELFVEKSSLFDGVNVVRLLDNELNSISERIVYNQPQNYTKLNLVSSTKIKDSIKVKASILGKIGNFSITVLPKNTKSNFNNNTIYNNLAFKNYIDCNDFDYAYYFSNFNKRKAFELDLLLLHTTESKYNWSHILNQAPKPTYTFDMGLTVSGKINQIVTNKENTKLRLFSINGLEEYTAIKEDNSFEFQNIMAIDSSTLYFSLIKKDDKLESLGIYSKIENTNRRFIKNLNIFSPICQEVIYTKNTYDTNYEFPKIEGVLELNDVSVIEVKKIKLERQGEYGNSMAKGYKISDSDAGTFRDVLSFIGSHGYDVVTQGGQVTIRNRVSTSFLGSRTPVVFLDNVQLFDFTFLLNMTLNDIDEIYINKRGYGMGSDGSNGSIRIYTKKITAIKSKPNQIKSKPVVVKNGFQPFIEFEKPKYALYQGDAFENYGTINWIPNIYTDENGEFEFSTPFFGQKELTLNIQGIDNKGQLYNETLTIEVK